MDGQELYNLYEAYMEVVMNEGLRVLPREKMQSKASSKRRKALASALKSKFTTGKGTTERNVIDAKNQKLRSQADKMDQVAGDYTPSGSRNKEAKNRGGSYNPRNRMGSDEYVERQIAKNRAMLGMGEEVDLYDIILSHLLDEGYAETLEAAEAMMVNMSEEWRDSILEAKKEFPHKKVDRQVYDAMDSGETAGDEGDSAKMKRDYGRADRMRSVAAKHGGKKRS